MKTLLLVIFLSTYASSQFINTYPFMKYDNKLEGVNVTDTTLEIIYRSPCSYKYCEGGGPPDIVWKDVYKVVNGKIQYVYRIDAKVTNQYIVPENVEWER